MKRSTLLLLLYVASVTACAPAAEEPANEMAPSAAEEESRSTPSVAGEWTVTAVNSQPLTQIFQMNASVAGDRFTIRSDCVRIAWNYTQNRNIVAFTKASVVNCPRGRTENEDEVEKAIGGATIALFSDDGREVQLSGNGGTATMTRR